MSYFGHKNKLLKKVKSATLAQTNILWGKIVMKIVPVLFYSFLLRKKNHLINRTILSLNYLENKQQEIVKFSSFNIYIFSS